MHRVLPCYSHSPWRSPGCFSIVPEMSASNEEKENTLAEAEDMDPNEAQSRLQQMRDNCSDLIQKINSLDMDNNEHRLVEEALAPLDPGRKCFRMVGSIIVERTVNEVLPAVKLNKEKARPRPKQRVLAVGHLRPPAMPLRQGSAGWQGNRPCVVQVGW